MHQPWRSFPVIINKCLSGKTTSLESLRLSRAQILWGMYHNKQVDYVYLLWEDLVFQVENKNSKKNNGMFYPHFTKVIVDYIMAKDQAIPRRNKMVQFTKGVTSRVFLGNKVQVDDKEVIRVVLGFRRENEGAGDKPEVPDVHKYRSESKEESWTFSQGEDKEEDEEHDSDDDNDDEDDDQENDSQRTESDDEGDDFVHPNLSTYIADDQEKEKEEEKADDDDECDDDTMGEEQDDEDNGELYRDLNINLSRSDAEMTDTQTNPETKEAHVTLTTKPLVVQLQSSSASSDLVTKFINPSSDTALSSIPGIVDKYLAAKVKDMVDVAVQLKSDKLRAESQFVTLKRGRDDQDKDEEPFAGSNRGSKRQRSSKEESSKEATQKKSKSISSSKGTTRSLSKSSGKFVQEEEHDPRVDDLEEPFHQEFDTGNDNVSPVREATDVDERLWNPSGF
ncbi:hypothetical protein Tco_0456696 [Tanacetum coccineum]